jgi:hypothetical protein
MADDGRRDWVDAAAKLLVPLVIFGVGFQYSCQKDKVDRTRQQFDRDAGYVKALASDNEREREVTLAIVDALIEQKEFTPALRSAVAVLAAGKRDEPSTKIAQRVLDRAAETSPALNAQIQQTAQALPIRVYIQIANPDQRKGAETLRSELSSKGFVAPGVELRADESPDNTEIRYFSQGDQEQARSVAGIAQQLGYKTAQVKDSSGGVKGKAPVRQLEVWLGKRQS